MPKNLDKIWTLRAMGLGLDTVSPWGSQDRQLIERVLVARVTASRLI